MRLIYPALLSTMLLSSPALAQSVGMSGAATMSSPSATSSLSIQDSSFIKKAAQAGMAEVNQGKLAQSNGGPSVQSLAATMVADHTKANDQLKAIAMQLGAPVPAMTDPADAQMTAMLQPLHGTAFDAKYLHGQRLAHLQAIALFKTEIASGRNPQLKAFAQQTLPTLQGHLKMIEDHIKAGSQTAS